MQVSKFLAIQAVSGPVRRNPPKSRIIAVRALLRPEPDE